MIPTVLLYNLDTEKGLKIKALCLTLKLRARSVAQEDFSQPLDSVLGLVPRQSLPRRKSAFRRADGDGGAFLPPDESASPGVSQKENPAGGAEGGSHRRQWGRNAFQLCRELRLEHQAMLRGENLHEGGTCEAADLSG